MGEAEKRTAHNGVEVTRYGSKIAVKLQKASRELGTIGNETEGK